MQKIYSVKEELPLYWRLLTSVNFSCQAEAKIENLDFWLKLRMFPYG